MTQVKEIEGSAIESAARGKNRDHRSMLRLRQAGTLLAVALLAILIDGYHPYSEDAGIYVASLKKLAQPSLYPSSGAFLAPYGHLSLFSHLGAWLLRGLHLPLQPVLFTLHVATTWLFLYGSYGLARRCFGTHEGRWGGTLLIALCLCVPVAGTSLSIMDPYLTGRSFSTPFTLLAVCALLDRSLWRTCLFLSLATLFHPLMGAYAIGFSLVLWAVQRRSWLAVGTMTIAGIFAAAAVHTSQASIAESTAYKAAVATRTYFFLSEWHWYEIVGIAAPIVLIALFALLRRNDQHSERFTLAMSCTTMGVISIVISLLFCHPASYSHAIAALQPLRPFVFIYISMFVILGGLLGEFVLQRVLWRWSSAILIAGTSLGFAQHTVYSASPQVELPGTASSNPWRQAFEWIQSDTPANAIVALDANYINVPGEDSLGFRAVAERDSLADRSKDGGAAAVFPELANRWLLEQTATTGLNQIDDRERRRRLAPFHVSWIVLDRTASTDFVCPFRTTAVQVCRLQ